MIAQEKALELVIKNVKKLKSEKVNLEKSLYRVLAQDIFSDTDMPPFDKSAMDGYACRKKDLDNELTVIETIPAGYLPKKKVGVNQCSKIMTGGVVPKGADCVIIVEMVECIDNNKIIFKGKSTSTNICKKGEDIKKGKVLLKKGEIIQPQHIAILATAGVVNPLVFYRPKVGIIATGSELINPKKKLSKAFIRNSNSYQLSAQVAKMGAVPNNYGIVKDSKDLIDKIIKKAIKENHVILLSGGVSMGDYDFVPEILKANGIKIVFDRVAVKPGKPTTFGYNNKAICFGLPGNPVSTFIIFELFVKPLLFKLMGHDYKPLTVSMTLDETLTRKKTDRQAFVPVKKISNNKIHSIEFHGSAHINSLTEAIGIVSFPKGINKIKKGTVVDVRQI